MQKEKQSGGMDYDRMMREVEALANEYGEVSVSYIGTSVMGRGIPLISIGEGEKQYLYVNGHRADEWKMAAVLIRWVREYCSLLRARARIFRFGTEYLYKSRTVCVVPMLNPDGMEYRLHGVPREHVLYDRLVSMNGTSPDFSEWKSNGRGVDLRYNYSVGFEAHKVWEREQGIMEGRSEGFAGESSESEPEIGYLCNYLRYLSDLMLVVSFHEDTPSLYCAGALGQEPRTKGAEQVFSRMLGIGNRGCEDGLIETSAQVFGRLGCSVGIGTEGGTKELFALYERVREFLFVAPTMV